MKQLAEFKSGERAFGMNSDHESIKKFTAVEFLSIALVIDVTHRVLIFDLCQLHHHEDDTGTNKDTIIQEKWT